MKETIYGYMRQVSEVYKRLRSLQKTADELGIAYAKVRKILITLGEYETEFSIEAAKRRRNGKSISEIAEELNTTTNRVNAFLPYEKIIYDIPERTVDSKKSKLYRNRIKLAKENFVAKEKETIDKSLHAEINKDNAEKEKPMENKLKVKKSDFTTIRLHLDLIDENLTEYQKRMLRRYGEASTGESISRDILIPSDMMLHNLHYAIQRLFGWQNSHLRKFILPAEIYQRVTGGTVKGWADLVGILFQPPSEAENDIFWDDNYQGGSIKVWLKRKYTGPYYYGGVMEHFDKAKKDVHELLDYYTMIDVKESFHEYWEHKKTDNNAKIKVLRRAPLIDLTLDEMNNSIIIEGGTESLMESLEINKLLAAQDEALDESKVLPVTKELIYNYDFGDNWVVKITKKIDYEDLLASGVVSEEEIAEADETVMSKHTPVCIHKDGIFVLDDVGGLGGFADFLGTIYESKDKEERAGHHEWAQSLGWSTRKVSNKLIL
jgi:hypothetical protein